MRFLHYLRTAEKIIGEFDHQTPLPAFLRNYYRRDRRMGSTDRRTISSLVYSYFRTGNLLSHLPVEERLQAAWFLCHEDSTALLEYCKPEWNLEAGLTVAGKLALLEKTCGPIDPLKIFPFYPHLSAGIDPEEYALSMLRQPDLFIRINRVAAVEIKEKLVKEAVKFRELTPTCLAFDNALRITETLDGFKGSFEVQDLSSQHTGDYFRPLKRESWWDACAGSGGKALMLNSLEPSVKLYLTDNRPAILKNLEQRFQAAAIFDYKLLQTDLTDESAAWKNIASWKGIQFDGIILDTSCSGSGTWGRSPEIMTTFKTQSIQRYTKLQKAIAGNIIPFLKPGKPLIYITCSVFREENEELADFICKEFDLEMETQALLKGYEHKADTMFVARLIKN